MGTDWAQLATNTIPTVIAVSIALISVLLTAWLSFRYQVRLAAQSSARDGRKQAYVEALEAIKKTWTAVGIAVFTRKASERTNGIIKQLSETASLKAARDSRDQPLDPGEDSRIADALAALKKESHELNWEIMSVINTSRALLGMEIVSQKVGWGAFGDVPSTQLLSDLNSVWLRIGASAESQLAAAQVMMQLERAPSEVRTRFAQCMSEMKEIMVQAQDSTKPFQGVQDSWFAIRLESLGKAASDDLDALLTT